MREKERGGAMTPVPRDRNRHIVYILYCIGQGLNVGSPLRKLQSTREL